MQFNQQEAAEAFMQIETLEVPEISVPEITAADSPNVVLSGVCRHYQTVRPFLLLIASLFFVPEKWKAKIRSFTTNLDVICPQG